MLGGGGGGGAGPAFGPAPFLLGGEGGGGSKRSAPLFPGPQGEPAHGLHPRFVVAEIWADRGAGGGGGAGGSSEGRECPKEELLRAGGLGEPRARKREGGNSDGRECPTEERRGGLGFGGLRARRREGLAEVDGLSDFDGGCTASPESSASCRNSSPRVLLAPVAGRRAGFSSSEQRASSDSGQNSRTEVSSHRTPELVGQGSRRWWWKTKSSGAAA